MKSFVEYEDTTRCHSIQNGFLSVLYKISFPVGYFQKGNHGISNDRVLFSGYVLRNYFNDTVRDYEMMCA